MMSTLTMIVNRIAAAPAAHPGVEIWQMEKCARQHNSKSIVSIQTKEIGAGNAIERHICAYIQFRERREARDGRHATRTDMRHMKRHNTHPALSIKGIQREH